MYEEEYLINSIKRLIERMNSVGEEIERLIEGLMRRGMRERAIACSVAMEDVGVMCRGCVAEVFGTGKESGMHKEVEAGEDEVDGFRAGDVRIEAPAVRAFEKLSLLG